MQDESKSQKNYIEQLKKELEQFEVNSKSQKNKIEVLEQEISDKRTIFEQRIRESVKSHEKSLASVNKEN